MDHRPVKGGTVAAILFLFTAEGLGAHPHARVDQQAHLSIGRSQAIVTFYITPSARDGGHMFDHIDADRNGLLDRAERRALGRALIAQTRLNVDGRPIALDVTHFAFPDRTTLVAGGGAIRVRARANPGIPAGSGHRVSFDVAFHRFARRWHVQPFLFADLAQARPVVQRNKGTDRIVLTIQS